MITPAANTEMMNPHLDAISTLAAAGAVALLSYDSAGGTSLAAR